MSSVKSLRRPWDSSCRDSLARLVEDFDHPVEAFGDHRLSKLGDALLNLIYSLSLSVHGGVPEGKKIPNSVLAKALESSSHKSIVPKRSDRHRKGDLVEAIFAFAWLKGLFEIRSAAQFLADRHQAAGGALDIEVYSVALSELMDRMLSEMGIPEDE